MKYQVTQALYEAVMGTNPTGAESGNQRVQRGGSYSGDDCAVAIRYGFTSYDCNYNYGIRLARSILR